MPCGKSTPCSCRTLATRGDLNRVIQWMCSELSVGHHRGGGGDTLYQAKDRGPGGLLGADYSVENGRYRFKKVYGGLNWNPELRSPLTEPGVDVKAGEYLIAVRGQDLRPPTNIYSLFENTVGQNHRDHRWAEPRRIWLAHCSGGADCQRRCVAQSRLGRRQPEES